MGTPIEWTDQVWNPTVGCTAVSAGCHRCYAAREAVRLQRNPSPKIAVAYAGTARMTAPGPNRRAVFTGRVNLLPDRLDAPLRWRKPRRVFVNSMSDLFHPDVPFEFVDCILAVMALTPRHVYQVLTKRPGRMAEYFADLQAERIIDACMREYGDDAWSFAGNWIDGWSAPQEAPKDGNPLDGSVKRWPLPNLWIGTSCEDQAAADERIPHLLRTPAAVRFLSCEPLLGPIDLDGIWGVPG